VALISSESEPAALPISLALDFGEVGGRNAWTVRMLYYRKDKTTSGTVPVTMRISLPEG
jgi:hypothetical protein